MLRSSELDKASVHLTMMQVLSLTALLLVFPWITSAQFPAVCNTPENLQNKTCCPNDCGSSSGRGNCTDITTPVAKQWIQANSDVVRIMLDAPNQPQKRTADSRYQWPTVVFEKVCKCSGNFSGVDCGDCAFGWTGGDCATRKTPVFRKSFASLSAEEKQTFVDATRDLKNEMGIWSVVVEEPSNYSSGTVTLQNVSTYDFFVYLHNYAARGDSSACFAVNNNTIVDFAHSGPVFPVWHRRYLLIVEKEFQRITNNDSFGFPYWQWEEDDRSPFTREYYGIPPNSPGDTVNVTGSVINPVTWNTVCDISYWLQDGNCSDYWTPCNPADDLAARRPLQRGGGTTYLPNIVEVMIAIAAPDYDAPDETGMYLLNSPRTSFRSRMEGLNRICSAVTCVGSRDVNMTHMHINVHLWVGGQMSVVPGAINDPIFSLHHCNVDRILESWMQRFTGTSSDSTLLPAYVPETGGHPGHNRDDYMVPFFPLITAGEQYRVAEEWGYTYDELIPANIPDDTIPNCSDGESCPVCDASGMCIDCNASMADMCPAPNPTISSTESLALPVGVGVGLGTSLLIALTVVLILII